MKQFQMNDGKGKPPRKPSAHSRPTDQAFDKWLTRGLHEMFDDVIKEPVPPEILKLLQDDKEK